MHLIIKNFISISLKIWPVLARGSTVLPATRTRTSQPQSITALWPILIVPTHGGMARLS